MAKHQTIIPWGKHKGERLRHLPDDYLSWLYDTLQKDDKDADDAKDWKWLFGGVRWEIRRRGFRTPELEIELQKKEGAATRRAKAVSRVTHHANAIEILRRSAVS